MWKKYTEVVLFDLMTVLKPRGQNAIKSLLRLLRPETKASRSVKTSMQLVLFQDNESQYEYIFDPTFSTGSRSSLTFL